MIKYRKANIDDAAILAKIRSIFLMEANDVTSEIERSSVEIAIKQYLETALENDSFIAWLAIYEDNIIATSGLTFSVVPPSFKCLDGKVAYIMNMYTIPDYRQQGIGTELLKRTVDEARSQGYKRITLHATDMGRALYEKYGFKDSPGYMILNIE